MIKNSPFSHRGLDVVSQNLVSLISKKASLEYLPIFVKLRARLFNGGVAAIRALGSQAKAFRADVAALAAAAAALRKP